MDYRSPTAGLERTLADRELELERLRARPRLPPEKRPRPRKSREERALEQRLAQLERALAKAGYRELTERESSQYALHVRIGVVLVVAGLAVASAHLVLCSAAAMTWARATCSIVEAEEDVHVARYVSHGARFEFSASGHASQSDIACWVPEPPRSGVGRLDEPPIARVSLRDKVRWGWLGSSAFAVLAGIAFMFGARHEARNRRRNVIARDDFSSSDD